MNSPSSQARMSALSYLYDHLRDFPTWFSRLSPGQLEAIAGVMTHWQQQIEDTSISRMEEIERREVLRAVALCHGNLIKAAKALGIGKTTIHRRLKCWGYTVQNRTLMAQAAALKRDVRGKREHVW